MKNRVCEILGIEKPIIQGPMNWLTNGEFVGAVSKAGALGVLGINAGQKEIARSTEEKIENMRREISKVKAITDRPFGINICPRADDPKLDQLTEGLFELMVQEKVKVAVMVGGLMPGWVSRFREKGIRVVYRPLDATAEITEKSIAAGVDIIVATGFDEGGTLPTRAIGTFSIVPLIVDAAAGRIPVMAAGGITDERTAKASFALGAEGLYVGTAFMMSEECPLADNIKTMAKNVDAHDLIMYRTIPAFYRSLRGELPEKLLKMSEAGASEEEIFKAQNAYVGMRDGMLFGDLSRGYASFGLGISLIRKIEPVSEIISRLMKGISDI
ncbi:nitronate monooxygenase family protein [Succinivibrio sp.]|uniref:NAD(P)H-dependent flavin oxidoreductase n=1 Tax=Succinivibrio sp. TaxID=2053619 RepID=UPI0025FEAD70|nr:nitronate monooxygenase [Succinivibrio sp.]MBQ9221505.1 nitronate monooxygenase [Succinivibrio sp.]